ncbi:YdhK family protein [Leucobacter sp. wl10]|uniref:YdhK family protein n=1 Tax=Leucobacter sp. wl10 TaxID=2304677 RepID=UPI000E5ACD52|nr:YdhK family protein [Leucobacter sp. wl10]RGE21482.1 DUF1541 domain-containing protein [Leucobacter sp. wl10]
MNAAGRLALYGAGLAVAFGGAFGLAGVLVPDSLVEAWSGQSGMSDHGEGADEMTAQRSGGMDHPADGGPPPAGIRAASDPAYPVGTEVVLAADHMPGMDGAKATISGAFDTTAYSVTYTPTTGGDPVTGHRWVVHEELEAPGPAPLADGTAVVLRAEHAAGMQSAAATIESSTDETVYMVDLEVDGMRMTNHKWVVESEIRPAR